MEGLKRILFLLIGWFFIGLGLLGLFLPFLQGILFLMIGLLILSTHSTRVKGWVRRFEERHPHYHEHMEKWRGKLRKWFKRGEKAEEPSRGEEKKPLG
ncbi:MAG: DUF454 family protein [Desulfobacterota bacterium]|nr:DUF454 family protein [Thermodesulfobacteriota bacterium]